MAILDLRQSDERTNVLPNPYWVRSAALTVAALNTDAVLFSFPAKKGTLVLVHQVAFQLVTAFNGTSASVIIGSGTIATDAVTTGGAISIVDADEYFATGEITEATPAWYWPATSDFFGVLELSKPYEITPADTTVPIIYANYTATAGTATTALGYLHMLVSEIH